MDTTVAKKKTRRTSPTARSLKWLRDRGWVAGVVEKWNPHVGIRQDLWGWCDIVALAPDRALVSFIQVTSTSNAAARVTKIREWPYLAALLASGCTVVVHGWAKQGPRGKRKTWTLRVEMP